MRRFFFICFLWVVYIIVIGCTRIDESEENHIHEDAISISCWGDSKTYGNHGYITSSYPDILKTLLSENGYSNKIYNFGANGERSTEILQRQGALPLYVEHSFVIPSSCNDSVPVYINSRLRIPDSGCNPCIILGVEGRIIKDFNDRTDKTFYFKRLDEGGALSVPDSTQIFTDAMVNHKDDIMIIDIGYNGGYKDTEELIAQINMMIDYNNSKKYIVLGRVDHKMVYNELENKLSLAYGDRFVNLREHYIKNGLELNGIEMSLEDRIDISRGIAPGSLFYDSVHENYYGYYCKAKCVFDKLKELNFLR